MSRFLKLLEEAKIANNPAIYTKKLETMIEYLKGKENVLLLATSNRWEGDKEQPKSTQLAEFIKNEIKGDTKVELIDVSKLTIHCCEGRVYAA